MPETLQPQSEADPVGALLAAIEGAAIPGVDVFSVNAALDATVPNWRMSITGASAIRDELANWYRDPGRFEELTRTLLPDGELVSYTLCWEEQGMPHAAHQVHVLTVEGGKITADRLWCGGRWPASLLAEMEQADRARR